jgi:hypothetical protein
VKILKDELSRYLTYIGEESNHWIFRCPVPGCESKNMEHGHLHIHKTEPVFRCVKCDYSGHISKLLNDINAHDIKITNISSIQNINKKKIKNKKKLQIELDNEFEQIIEEYMYDRLRLEKHELYNLNLLSVSTARQLLPTGKYISDNSIPFLTNDNGRLIVRLLDNLQYRYMTYSLTNEFSDYYCIKNKKKFTNMYKYKTIVVAEGIFDVISQFKYRWVDSPDDAVYVAASTSYLRKAISYASNILLSYHPNIIILEDSDIPPKKNGERYQDILNYTSLKIYRNEIGKDFGCLDVKPKLIFKS